MRPAKTAFVKRDVFYGTLKILEKWELEFINQDNTEKENQKLENIIKKFEWRKDRENMFATIFLASLATYFIFTNMYLWYYNNFLVIFRRSFESDALANFIFSTALLEPHFFFFKNLYVTNFWLLEVLTNLNFKFNLFF